MIRAPSAIAAAAAPRTSSSAAASPAPPSETRYRQRITLDRNPCGRPLTLSLGSRLTSLASSWLRRIGWGSTIWWQEFWSGLSKSRSPPVVPCRLVTTSSRMASNGGLVTWANS
ncbi:Uncharacterised protein [Mycobacterium tuberculosis]|nr:Uncharacterised protein [Mycobacterium tuberculosis]CFE55545.1 Uncharacterised protein [Mycobacterium tuberculosis]CFS01713.1 Uncharacterised protein [Mycobacterium tuberculosis]CKP89910.1 Uncharacterised protein [Mycobacterium tuberculosis]CKQ30253.1 Uncharacterised protein [Mycobacterium tuberculosis]